MVNYVHTVLKPENLALYFPTMKKRPSTQIVGFGWWQGWQDGCSQGDTSECESLSDSLTHFRSCSKLLVSTLTVNAAEFCPWSVQTRPIW